MITLIVTQKNQTVAVIEGWDGPVPRAGDYIYHPGKPEPVIGGAISGCVRQVVWGIYARPQDGKERHFVNSAAPFAEVVI
jgi:hypothetical protein